MYSGTPRSILTQNTYIHAIPGMHQQAVRNTGEMLLTANVAGG